jgi:glycosyltransferase involved in cell wall biosynthesis
VDCFANLFPDADLYTLWVDDKGRYPGRHVFESPLARTAARRKKALALPAMSWTWRHLDVSQYDAALISSHAFAHHLGSGPGQRHLQRHVYVHSPARYLWARDIDSRGGGAAARAVAPFLRMLDARHVAPGRFATNSRFVQERIWNSWRIPSEVVYPPVDVAAIQQGLQIHDLLPSEAEHIPDLPERFILGASRFVEYKRLSDVIKFGESVGVPVVLAGRGPLLNSLKHMGESAAVQVKVIDSPSDSALRWLYANAEVFVYPPIEDFGIMAVEAIASGTPTIVHSVGGATETIAATGGGAVVDFDDLHPLFASAYRTALSCDMAAAKRAAQQFDKSVFTENVSDWLAS